MATVHVLVGQCGNQLGSSFLNALAEEGGGQSCAGVQQKWWDNAGAKALHSENESSENVLLNHDPFQRYHRMVSLAHFRSGNPRIGPRAGKCMVRLPQPRCVLVDMEPQVIAGMLRKDEEDTSCMISMNDDSANVHTPSSPPLFQYVSSQCATRAEGSGSNWALGYFHQGESRRERIENCLRREIEAQDTCVRQFHVIHSLAGGTGSGVGSLISEIIRDFHTSCSLLHAAVWPFESGEVVTQWYNLCLTISALRATADGVHVLFNDSMTDYLTKGSVGVRNGKPGEPREGALKPLSTAESLHRIDLNILNAALADTMLPLHLPHQLFSVPAAQYDASRNRIPTTPGSIAETSDQCVPKPIRFARPEDVLDAVGIDPTQRFFSGVSIPLSPAAAYTPSNDIQRSSTFSAPSWASVISEAARVADQHYSRPPSVAELEQRIACAYSPRSCLWCVRGPGATTLGIRELQHVLSTREAQGLSPFPLSSLFVHPCTADARQCRVNNEGHSKLLSLSRSVNLYGPSLEISERSYYAAERASDLLRANAYTHHYEKFGVESSDLADAVAVTYDLGTSYAASF